MSPRASRFPILNFAVEIAAVFALLGASVAIGHAWRARIEAAVPPCMPVREVPAGQLSLNPLRIR